MSDISVIGLGAMGSALAKVLVKAGHSVTVWNRSPERIGPIVALGAQSAPDLSDVIRASPRIIICIADYKATSMILDQPGVRSHLSDRTLIQFSTGTPKEANDSDIWARHQGGSYLDGAIMVNPGDLGTDDAQILMAGSKEAFQRCQPFLKCLGGDLRYLGENVRAAAALNLALLSRIECMVFGVVHGARICEAEGISLEQFAALLPAGGISLAHLATLLPKAGEIAISVNGAADVVASLQDQARDAGINSEIPDFLMNLLDRAIAAGYGEEDSAKVIEVLRGITDV